MILVYIALAAGMIWFWWWIFHNATTDQKREELGEAAPVVFMTFLKWFAVLFAASLLFFAITA